MSVTAGRCRSALVIWAERRWKRGTPRIGSCAQYRVSAGQAAPPPRAVFQPVQSGRQLPVASRRSVQLIPAPWYTRSRNPRPLTRSRLRVPVVDGGSPSARRLQPWRSLICSTRRRGGRFAMSASMSAIGGASFVPWGISPRGSRLPPHAGSKIALAQVGDGGAACSLQHQSSRALRLNWRR